MKIRWVVIGLIITSILVSLYTYKILDVPTGLTVDEASFGYNAALLAQTGRDERGILHPFFVLYVKGNDWRQPITQYYLALLFKIFGSSVFLLRFSSVIIAILCVFGVFYLSRMLMGTIPALISAAAFAMAPLVMIQAHMGLDNIMPVPFVILWLIGLKKYQKSHSLRWLCLSGIALGASIYSYKGARAIAPIWMANTILWLLIINKNIRTKITDLLIFTFSFIPFFLVIPYFEKIYPGAILGNSNPVVHDVYQFLSPYFSSFDPSFLFIRGDITDFHSTGKHGMILLATLPLIIVGIYAVAKSKDAFNKLVLFSLFTGPFLFGTVGSVHRFSRLMALIPLFSVITGLGWGWFWEQKNKLLKYSAPVIVCLMFLNFADFAYYYWNKYPPTTFNLLGDMDFYKDVERFAKEVDRTGMDPVTHEGASLGGGESMKFFQQVYFKKQLLIIPDDDPAEPGQLLLTTRKVVPSMEPVGKDFAGYIIQETKE